METDFNPAEGTNAMAIRNVAVAFVVAIAMIGTTSAANRTWKSAVGSGSWSERGNWEEDAVPAAGDTVILQRTTLARCRSRVSSSLDRTQ